MLIKVGCIKYTCILSKSYDPDLVCTDDVRMKGPAIYKYYFAIADINGLKIVLFEFNLYYKKLDSTRYLISGNVNYCIIAYIIGLKMILYEFNFYYNI